MLANIVKTLKLKLHSHRAKDGWCRVKLEALIDATLSDMVNQFPIEDIRQVRRELISYVNRLIK